MACIFFTIRLLEVIHRLLSFIFRKLERETSINLNQATIQEIQDHYDISYRQARKLWLRHRPEKKKPRKLLDVFVMGNRTTLLNNGFKVRKIGG